MLFQQDGEKTYVMTPEEHLNPHHEAGCIVKYESQYIFIPSGEGVYLNTTDMLEIALHMERLSH